MEGMIQVLTMREYAIVPAAAPLPGLTGTIFDPVTEPFCAGEYAPIDTYAWGGDYRPEARAYVVWDDAGLRVLLCAREATVSAKVNVFNGDVWTDSCLEFFLRPFADDARYLNIEVNAAGAPLIGIGAGRNDRMRLESCPEGMDFRASEHDGAWWAVAYTVPYALIEALYGRKFAPGTPFEGNFYCCDETLHPHFGSWNPIAAPEPDFHRPECFGRLVMGE